MNRRRGIKAKPARKSAGALQSGAGCQKNFTLCEGEEVFFLDIPFYSNMVGMMPARCLSAHRLGPRNFSHEPPARNKSEARAKKCRGAAVRGWMPKELHALRR